MKMNALNVQFDWDTGQIVKGTFNLYDYESGNSMTIRCTEEQLAAINAAIANWTLEAFNTAERAIVDTRAKTLALPGLDKEI